MRNSVTVVMLADGHGAPSTFTDSWKRFFLGKPLINDDIEHESLSNPIALGALSPALLSDYVVTVAIQCSAGTVAVVSAILSLGPYHLEITVGALLLLSFGNLRAMKEGRLLHARTADKMAAAISRVDGATAQIVAYDVGSRLAQAGQSPG